MKLYNSLIRSVSERLGKSTPKQYPYDPNNCWPETDDFELVMMRDSACEMGGEGKPCAALTLITDDPSLVEKDEILVYGKDLTECKGSAPYARIAIVLTGDIEPADGNTEKTFRAIQNIDFVKYHVFPRGFMMRTSSESQKEQVRLSKSAVSQGINFRAVGNAFLRHYKQDPNVKAVKLIFVTAPDADYKQLLADAKSVKDITMTLSKITKGMPKNCGSCGLKPICDEVEGMKELHFGKKDK